MPGFLAFFRMELNPIYIFKLDSRTKDVAVIGLCDYNIIRCIKNITMDKIKISNVDKILKNWRLFLC